MEGILALDPAGPIYETNSETTRLGKNDAKAVQVFHTNSNGMFPFNGFLGYDPLCGTVDFYFNGAKYQPARTSQLTGYEAHRYAYEFLLALNNRNRGDSGGGYRNGTSNIFWMKINLCLLLISKQFSNKIIRKYQNP